MKEDLNCLTLSSSMPSVFKLERKGEPKSNFSFTFEITGFLKEILGVDTELQGDESSATCVFAAAKEYLLGSFEIPLLEFLIELLLLDCCSRSLKSL